MGVPQTRLSMDDLCLGHIFLSLLEVRTLAKIIKAKVGDIILFERKERTHEGKVTKVQDNSVLVQIDDYSKAVLGYENNNTVVSHKNYTIFEQKKEAHAR